MKFKFNWVDLVIILLIVAVGLVGFKYLSSRKTVANAETKKLYFVFETDKNLPTMAEQWTVGTEVVFGQKKVDKGVITAVEVVPFRTEIADMSKGEWVMNNIPNMSQARVRIEFDGFESEKAFSASQEQLTVGLGTVVSGKGVNSEGYVLDVGAVQ